MKTQESKELEWAVDALRRSAGPSDSARTRVQQRLAATLVALEGAEAVTHGENGATEGSTQLQRAVDVAAGSGPGAAPAAGSAAAGVGLATKLFVGVVGVGAILAVLPTLPPSEPAEMAEPPALPAAPTESPPPLALQTVEPELDSLAPIAVEALPTLPAGRPTARENTPSLGSRERLEDEQRLLDSARRSLTSGRAAAALGTLDTHRARHPQGVLAQEREALRIKATAALGEHAQASRLLKDFEARYPGSLHAPSVQRSVDAAGRETPAAKPGDGNDSLPPSP